MLLPLLLVGLVGLVVLEKRKKGASSRGDRRCAPTATLEPYHVYLFGMAAPQGAPPVGRSEVEALAQTLIQTGRWHNAAAWARGDVEAPTFEWPKNAPKNAALVRAIYIGPRSGTTPPLLGIVDCGAVARTSQPPRKPGSPPAPPMPSPGPSSQQAPPRTVHDWLRPPLVLDARADAARLIVAAVQNLLAVTKAEAGSMGQLTHELVVSRLRALAAEPTLSKLSETIDKLSVSSLAPEGTVVARELSPLLAQIHTGWTPGLHAGNLYEDAVAGTLPPSGSVSVDELPRIVLHICTLVLAQAMDKVPLLKPAPSPPSPSQAGGGSTGLSRGKTYFAAWPSGGPPLRRDLWELGRVTDSARSPNHFAANPSQSPIALETVPASAPPPWLSAYGSGKAIAVLTWTGPEGGGDPSLEVLGEYAPQPVKRAA